MAGSALGSAVEHSLHTRGVGGSNPPARTIFLTACVLALATSIFYGLALSRQPVGRDEARIVSAAQQPITGVVINAGDRWLQPIPVLATKAAHVVRPGFHAGRWASVAISAINVGLMFLVVSRIFRSQIPALAAALILAFTPAHMTFGRTGAEAIYIVPFVLLWLYGLVTFVGRDRPVAIALASAALGAGVYTTTAAPLTMAFLWVAMIIALWIAGRRKLSTLGVAAGAFAVMLLPLAVWFALNPQTYPDTYGSWAIHAAHVRSPADGLSAFVNRNTLGTRATMYWALIDPSYLFFSSERGRAPLLWIAAPLIIAGIVRCVKKTRTAPASITLLGTLIAPLAGAGFGEPQYIANALALLPFVTLLAAYGVDWIRELIAGRPEREAGQEYETNEIHQSTAQY
jgi:hypothetical protein